MNRIIRPLQVAFAISAIASSSLALAAQQSSAQRTFQPEDLFRVRRVGATAWTPDGQLAVIELGRPGRSLDASVPSNEIALLAVKTRTLRTLSSSAASYLGFFNAIWSPDGKRLAFLSVDSGAVVRMWIWTVGSAAPVPIRDFDLRVGLGDPPFAWIGNDRIALMAWDVGAEKNGDLYFRILRGRNVADKWKLALDAKMPSVTALESGRATIPVGPSVRLVMYDLRAGASTTLARGRIHRLGISVDHRFITYLREAPGIPQQSVASYFEGTTDAEQSYAALNWGVEQHVIEVSSGNDVPPSAMPVETPGQSPKANPPVPLPSPDARRLSTAPTGDASLYLTNSSDGSRLWICGGAGRPMSSCNEIWRANQWMQGIKSGRSEPFSNAATDGTQLTAWLLLPPDSSPGVKLPVITIVYPGTVYGAVEPWNFSLFQPDFEHPQLFAALGYAVLMPSMPPAKDPADSTALSRLSDGVFPALDAVIARGIADPDRIAVLGQSSGGFAALGLITQTSRFRSAIASAGFSDLVSLYGTFYGQYRYGDAGMPQKGQVLRMLQLEKGADGMMGPPWAEAERYGSNSAVLSAGMVQTPLMLIHGDLDFIPIQQAEEFFTALYRQDKRATFLRYQGEWHTIANRANVLDMWKRIADWLTETM